MFFVELRSNMFSEIFKDIFMGLFLVAIVTAIGAIFFALIHFFGGVIWALFVTFIVIAILGSIGSWFRNS